MNNERLNNEQKAAVQGKESDLYINKTVNKHISNSENNIVIKNSDKIEKIKEKMTESCGSNISPIRRSENETNSISKDSKSKSKDELLFKQEIFFSKLKFL